MFGLDDDQVERLRSIQGKSSHSAWLTFMYPRLVLAKNILSDKGIIFISIDDNDDDKLKDMFGLDDDQVERLRSIQGKSSHSAWLTFMYPRLVLAKNILSDKGIIFISIDDNEHDNLSEIMNEIYGENNFITNFVWEKKKKPSFLNGNVGQKFEYVVCFAKNRKLTHAFSVEKTQKGKKYPFNNAGNSTTTLTFPPKSVSFSKINNETIKRQDMSSGNIKTELLNDVQIVDGRNVNRFSLRGEWRYSQDKLNEILAKGSEITISDVPFRPNLTKSGGKIKKCITYCHFKIIQWVLMRMQLVNLCNFSKLICLILISHLL